MGGQPGQLGPQVTLFSHRERWKSPFHRTRSCIEGHTSKAKQRPLDNREGKPATALSPRQHLWFPLTLSGSSRKGLRLFFSELQPCLDSGCARCPCGTVLLVHREGSEGEIKISTFLKAYPVLPRAYSEETPNACLRKL